MRKFVVILISFVILIGLVGCGPKVKGSLNLEVESFNYTNQDGKSFSSKELENKLWVADFVFTNCNTVCPPMTANLTKLKKMAEEKGLDIQFVSFSVDPEVDTPEKLKEFALKYQSDLKNWNLLTGYSMADIQTFARENFKTLVDKPEGEDQVLHGTSFYILDGSTLIKQYSGVSNVPFEEMISDLEALSK